MAEKERPKNQVITGVVRLSFARIWEPHAMREDQEKKYSASLIIPKSDKATLRDINAAIEAAKELGKAKWGGKIPKLLKLPLRDGDAEREDEAYANSYFVNANAKTKPGIVDKNVKPILDSTEVYSGCYVKASITFYPFDAKQGGTNGIACGLNHIMKIKDGEPLGGRSKVEDDFEPVEDDEDDDLM
jgi:hypothetical protein